MVRCRPFTLTTNEICVDGHWRTGANPQLGHHTGTAIARAIHTSDGCPRPSPPRAHAVARCTFSHDLGSLGLAWAVHAPIWTGPSQGVVSTFGGVHSLTLLSVIEVAWRCRA